MIAELKIMQIERDDLAELIKSRNDAEREIARLKAENEKLIAENGGLKIEVYDLERELKKWKR